MRLKNKPSSSLDNNNNKQLSVSVREKRHWLGLSASVSPSFRGLRQHTEYIQAKSF